MFLSIGEVGMRIVASLLPPPPDPVEVQKLRAQTLTLGKPQAKRQSRILSGFSTTRPRSTTAASKWQQTGMLVCLCNIENLSMF